MKGRSLFLIEATKMRDLQSAIYEGIKRGIQVCVDNECFGSAVTLIYSGIDAMSCLGMSVGQDDVKPRDFVAWCERYLRMPGSVEISGIEWYAARCAVVHRYGVQSKLSRQGKARMIGYMDHGIPEIRYAPEISTTLVIVSIKALAEALYAAIDRFLVDLFADSARRNVAEERLRWLLVVFDKSGDDARLEK
jgi:hypothetical protein